MKTTFANCSLQFTPDNHYEQDRLEWVLNQCACLSVHELTEWLRVLEENWEIYLVAQQIADDLENYLLFHKEEEE